MKSNFDQMTSDFKCKHCHHYISTNPALSGVNNRNHCPYCLYSRHLDLFEAGDRLSACKGEMRPVGVTLKQARKKYGRQQGELMLVHQCVDCGKISINRIAADDIAENILDVYQAALYLDAPTRSLIEENGVRLLAANDTAVVSARLFGWQAAPVFEFA